MRLAARTIAAALSILAVAACSGGKAPESTTSSAPATFSVTGGLTLGIGDFVWNSDANSCSGSGGYQDMRAGAQVVVSDAAGATVAVGSINQAAPYVPTGETRALRCELSFLVENVPADKGFYGVEVAHRGRLQYPENQMRQDLKLTLQ
jgi:hypothetical protein